jgi:hypothetical protein
MCQCPHYLFPNGGPEHVKDELSSSAVQCHHGHYTGASTAMDPEFSKTFLFTDPRFMHARSALTI